MLKRTQEKSVFFHNLGNDEYEEGMGYSMNQRFTKQLIWEAFYELSASIPFEKLTVEKIIKHSGISKATFYRHFRDKYDVLNYNSLAIAERLIGWQPCKDWHDFLLCMFREIEKEMDYYRRAFKTTGQNAHSRFLFEYSFGVVKECYLRANGRGELTTEEHYRIAHYCHGCVDTIADWIQEPSKMTVEQMADLFYYAMPENMRGTWNVKS